MHTCLPRAAASDDVTRRQRMRMYKLLPVEGRRQSRVLARGMIVREITR